MSRKEKMGKRIKNAGSILLPLILSSLDRIETISNIMDLRGFGKHKKRTWYSYRSFATRDFIAIALSLVIFSFDDCIYVHQWRPLLQSFYYLKEALVEYSFYESFSYISKFHNLYFYQKIHLIFVSLYF